MKLNSNGTLQEGRTRAVFIGKVQGKPAWKGEYQLQPNGMWFIARSDYGAICYADEASALAGAKVCQQKDWQS